jgi:hypothetical protein
MGRKESFIRGFEKRAAKEGLGKRIANWFKNPAAAERNLKKTNKYHLSRLALGMGIPLAGTAYLAHKVMDTLPTQTQPLRLQQPPNYY